MSFPPGHFCYSSLGCCRVTCGSKHVCSSSTPQWIFECRILPDTFLQQSTSLLQCGMCVCLLQSPFFFFFFFLSFYRSLPGHFPVTVVKVHFILFFVVPLEGLEVETTCTHSENKGWWEKAMLPEPGFWTHTPSIQRPAPSASSPHPSLINQQNWQRHQPSQNSVLFNRDRVLLSVNQTHKMLTEKEQIKYLPFFLHLFSSKWYRQGDLLRNNFFWLNQLLPKCYQWTILTKLSHGWSRDWRQGRAMQK